MATRNFAVSQETAGFLAEAVRITGRTPEDILREGLELFAKRHRLEKRRERFARAAGMWKDRGDLPDFGAMRREFDRNLPQETKDLP